MYIGEEAPDFTTTAFQLGKLRQVKLSEFRGRWVILEFYRGDFTYV